MTVNELVLEVIGNFEGEFFPSFSYLVSEYNRIIRSLHLLLPSANASVSIEVKDGKLESEILPEQIRRIFSDECELMAASSTLITLMPEARLYHATDDGIYVTVCGECTVYYRALPKALDDTEAMEEKIALDEKYVPMLRAWLLRSVYLYVGDFESANAYAAEYNEYFDDFKRENGVIG